MPNGYRHLTCAERCRTCAPRKGGLSVSGVAQQLGRPRSTVSREVRRNGGGRGQRHKQAQRKPDARRRGASSVPRKMTPGPWAMVEERLAEGWSPEQVSGRLRLEGHPMAGRQWIYRHVWTDRKAGGGLWRHLRRRGKKPNRKGGSHAGRGCIPGRVDISERPAVVEAKERVGDWEADTIVGKGHGGAVVSLVDRASKYTLLERVDRKTAAAVGAALTGLPGPLSVPVHAITADKGKEFADHVRVADALEAGFFFARPCNSRERGLNEHVNGLVLGHLPKGTDFRKVTDERVGEVQDLLNARHWKVLGCRTPAEAFRKARPP